MRVAILSESPADEAALEVLIGAVLGEPVVRRRPSLRARGWPNVAQVMPAIIRYLHFETDAEGLVVVVDSDDSVVHDARHEAPGYFHPRCRLCKLRAIFRQVTKNLPPAHGRERLLRGVGVAVPALEGWYLCGRDATVSEAAWVAGQGDPARPFTRRELKERVYGTSRPTLQHTMTCAVQEVERLTKDLRRLENYFPGFGFLVADLRTWKIPDAVAAGGAGG